MWKLYDWHVIYNYRITLLQISEDVYRWINNTKWSTFPIWNSKLLPWSYQWQRFARVEFSRLPSLDLSMPKMCNKCIEWMQFHIIYYRLVSMKISTKLKTGQHENEPRVVWPSIVSHIMRYSWAIVYFLIQLSNSLSLLFPYCPYPFFVKCPIIPTMNS